MSIFPEPLLAEARALVETATARGTTIATAESCTGGLVAALLTEVAGSSAVFETGFITYSNDAKTDLLGVDPALIARFGAVSEEVARAMAEGARRRAKADLAVAVTGIAGPGGGSAEKPVGLVHFACSPRDGATRVREERFGDVGRAAVRLSSVSVALDLLREALDQDASRFP